MGQRIERDALSRKAKRVAHADARVDVKPQHIWLRPAPEFGPDKFKVCYRLGEDKPTVVVKDPVKGTRRQWRAYLRFQSQFGNDRGYVNRSRGKARRGLAEVAVDAASKQAGRKIARSDVWVIPAVGTKPNRYLVCFKDAWNRSTDVVRHTVTADEAMWAEFCDSQERFDPGFRERVEAATAARAR